MNPYKAARLAKPMTQEILAGAAGIDVRTVRNLEKGGNASAETVLAVRAALDMGPLESDLSGIPTAPVPVRWIATVLAWSWMAGGFVLVLLAAFEPILLVLAFFHLLGAAVIVLLRSIFLAGYLQTVVREMLFSAIVPFVMTPIVLISTLTPDARPFLYWTSGFLVLRSVVATGVLAYLVLRRLPSMRSIVDRFPSVAWRTGRILWSAVTKGAVDLGPGVGRS